MSNKEGRNCLRPSYILALSLIAFSLIAYHFLK